MSDAGYSISRSENPTENALEDAFISEEHRPPGETGDAALSQALLAEPAAASLPTDLRPIARQLIAIAKRLEAASIARDDQTDRTLKDQGNGIEPDAAYQQSNDPPSGPPRDISKSGVAPAQGSGRDASMRRVYAARAAMQYKRRRRRVAIFGQSDLFGEPAWDILLDLYVAHVKDRPVSVSSACIGAAVPSSTALRWLGIMCDHELCRREHDPQDQRRVLVHLTDRALYAMDAYFAGLPTIDQP